MKSRVRDLLRADVCGRELIDELLAPASRREVAFLQERPQRFEVRRNDWLTAAPGHEREQGSEDENAIVACGVHQRRDAVRQGGDVGARLTCAAVGALRMQEVVLQVAENERGCLLAHAGSTIILPSA